MAQFKDEFEFPDEKEAKAAQAEAEDKFEVEIEDDTPEEDRGRKPSKKPVEEVTDEELSTYDEKVQARIKKFTRGYHDERRAKEEALREREAAEAYAKQIIEENKRLQQQLAHGSKALIETSKSAAETALNAAKERYKKAYEIADPDALAEAQTEIARATLDVERTASMRPHEVEEREFRQPEQPKRPVLSRRTQQWVDQNSDWWGQDDEMTAAAMGLDKKLQKQYGPDYVGTKEYFEAIDKTMRKRFPEFFAEDSQSDEDDEPPPRKKAEPADEDETPRRASKPATVVAPATRSSSPSRIKVTASEAAIARRLGVPVEEYARKKAALEGNR